LPKLYIITTEWTEQQWFSTGGTRAKRYLLAPDGNYYYFKRSQYKPTTQNKAGKDFKYEFWNEIIAYEIGSLLGFNVLKYDIAIDENIMGCISESMIREIENQELIEGVKYLQANFPEFDPSNKNHRTWYTFDLIEKALQFANIGGFITDILEVIVLDSLIGNGDRHQENWAIITKKRKLTEVLPEIINKPESASQKAILKLLKSQEDKIIAQGQKLPSHYYIKENSFAPIYDSGSSLGRELLPEKVLFFLSSEHELKSYIAKGTSEIHWENKKLSHFQLIRNLLNSRHKENITKIIERVIRKFDSSKIEQFIEKIDIEVPETHAGYRIPASRKRLIYKIITLRFEILRDLINERV
jgi:hypothetical protein